MEKLDSPLKKPDTRLSRFQRVTKSSAFREAFDEGPHYVGRFMILWLRSGEDAKLRLGVAAGRRSFRKAAERSRAKRLLREAYRLNRFRLHGDYDVILVSRRSILDASLQAIEKELLALAKKAGIVRNATSAFRPSGRLRSDAAD